MNHLSLTTPTTFHPQTPHAARRPFTPTRSSQPFPSVQITDSAAIAQLEDAKAPYLLVCELPEQLTFLQAYGARNGHLQLELVLPDKTDADALDNLESHLLEALLYCPDLSSLSLRFHGKAPPDFLNAVCALLAGYKGPLESLELFFRGARTDQCLEGMKELMCKRPGLTLVCKGTLAGIAAITARAHCAPDEVQLKRLDITCSASHSDHLVDSLARLRQPDMALALEFDDGSDPRLFIDALLTAGVAHTLRLGVSTADGDLIDLQERLDSLRRAHLDPGFHRFLSNGKLDCAELLKHCRAIGPGGAQLFAWACSAAAPLDMDELPELPIALSAYMRALNNEGVAYTATCLLPADAQALAGCDKVLIRSLRLDFGVVALGDSVMQSSAAALQQMVHLSACSVHRKATDLPFVSWLGSQLIQMPLEEVHFDLEGPEVVQPNPARSWVQLLMKPRLKRLVCNGLFSASLIMKVARSFRIMGKLPQPLPLVTLNLPPELEPNVMRWMQGIRMTELRLNIHFFGDFRPDALKAEVTQALRNKAPSFSLGLIDISSDSFALPMDDPSVLLVAKREIESWMSEADGQVRDAPIRQPISIDGAATGSKFAAAIGNQIDENSELTADQRERIRSAAPNLGDSFRHLASWLAPQDLNRLSAVNQSARSHFGNLATRQLAGAVLWVQDKIRQGYSAAYCRRLLGSLLGELVTEQVLKAATTIHAVPLAHSTARTSGH